MPGRGRATRATAAALAPALAMFDATVTDAARVVLQAPRDARRGTELRYLAADAAHERATRAAARTLRSGHDAHELREHDLAAAADHELLALVAVGFQQQRVAR